MSWKRKDGDSLKAALKSVLPNLLPVSEATEGGPAEYKAIDDQGNIYIIENPYSRPLKTNPDGSLTSYHKAPRMVIKADDVGKQSVLGNQSKSLSGVF